MSPLCVSTHASIPRVATSPRGTAQRSPYFTGLEWGLLRLRAGTYSTWDVRAEAVAYYGRPGPEAEEAVDGYLDAQDESEELPAPGELSDRDQINKHYYRIGLRDGMIALLRGRFEALFSCLSQHEGYFRGYNDAPAGDP